MAYVEVDEPIVLDSTGQDIKDELTAIKSAVQGLGTALGSDKANISGDNIASPSTFRQAIGLSSLSYMETVELNPASSKSTSLNTYGDACYLLIGLIAISASARGFLMVLFNVKSGNVHYNTVVNTNDFSGLTINSNGSVNINFSSIRYANLDIFRLTTGY